MCVCVCVSLRVFLCVCRPEELDSERWRDSVEVVSGDVMDPASLAEAFEGVTAAYYLIHSIGVGDDWRERDRRAAANLELLVAGTTRASSQKRSDQH